jgi:hypothetical protein
VFHRVLPIPGLLVSSFGSLIFILY